MNKQKAKLLAELEKDKSVVIGLASKVPYYVNTGHYGLNKAVSGMWHGGWPGGAVSELFGDPSTGKSLIVTRAMAALQHGEVYVPRDCSDLIDAADAVVYLDDTEGVYSESFCKIVGLDIADIIRFLHSQTVERHFEQAEDKIARARRIMKKAPLGVFLDSIAQLSTVHEMSSSMKTPDMTKAKQVHGAMRRYSDFIHTNSVLYLIANHVIKNIGVLFGPTNVPKGGGGLAFQTSVRVDLKYKTKFIRNLLITKEAGKRGDVYGVRTIPTAVKNKITAPFKYAVMDIYFDYGIDPYSGLMDYFTRTGQLRLKKAEKKGKSAEPAVYEFTAETGLKLPFVDGDFIDLIIEKDLLDIKRHGMKYMPPLEQAAEARTEESTEEGDFPEPPAPPVSSDEAAEVETEIVRDAKA